jgi:tripartite-type tricarboxylate transporter receptor subunit TctC
MNALIAGQVDYVCDPILGPMPHMQAGTIRALAIAAGKRNALLPEVPTAAEGGLPAFDAAPFYAIFAPKGTPQPIVDRLADALNKRGSTKTWRASVCSTWKPRTAWTS